MIDPVVERQYSDCRELLGLWKTFHDFFVMGVKGEHITAEKEAQFLDIKSRIAMLHDSFMEALTHDQNIGQEVLNIVSRAITLKHLNRQSNADIKKMEIEWHESYLLLNETIGTLEDKRNELSGINEAQYRAGKAGAAARQSVTSFFTSGGFKLAVIIGTVLFTTIGVQLLGIWDWNKLGEIKATIVPYRMGLGTYRSLINDEAPWPSIMAYNRLPYASWPAGVKEPEIKNESKDKIIDRLPVPPVAEILKGAAEYRMELTSQSNKGNMEIHTFRLPDTATGKKAKSEWETYLESPRGKELSKNWFLDQSYNIISIGTASDGEFLNGMRVIVFKQK